MDTTIIEKELIFNAHRIAIIINECESIQKDDESRYTKEMAKQTAYDHIVALVVGRGE